MRKKRRRKTNKEKRKVKKRKKKKKKKTNAGRVRRVSKRLGLARAEAVELSQRRVDVLRALGSLRPFDDFVGGCGSGGPAAAAHGRLGLESRGLGWNLRREAHGSQFKARKKCNATLASTEKKKVVCSLLRALNHAYPSCHYAVPASHCPTPEPRSQ